MATIGLSSKWIAKLQQAPETGMSYQIATIVLRDGTRFEQVAIVGDRIAGIRGRNDIPFCEDDIRDISNT